MKPIAIQNEYGETIEIKFDADGGIKIRHSDIDPKSWGRLHEYSKRMRRPDFQAYSAEREKELKMSPADAQKAKGAVESMGGYMVIRGKTFMVNAAEVALIHAAVKQAGGILPNWSS